MKKLIEVNDFKDLPKFSRNMDIYMIKNKECVIIYSRDIPDEEPTPTILYENYLCKSIDSSLNTLADTVEIIKQSLNNIEEFKEFYKDMGYEKKFDYNLPYIYETINKYCNILSELKMKKDYDNEDE